MLGFDFDICLMVGFRFRDYGSLKWVVWFQLMGSLKEVSRLGLGFLDCQSSWFRVLRLLGFLDCQGSWVRFLGLGLLDCVGSSVRVLRLLWFMGQGSYIFMVLGLGFLDFCGSWVRVLRLLQFQVQGSQIFQGFIGFVLGFMGLDKDHGLRFI